MHPEKQGQEQGVLTPAFSKTLSIYGIIQHTIFGGRYMPTVIYLLIDPASRDVRYVGQTVQALHQRLSSHIRRSNKQQNKKALWIRDLLSKGLKPLIKTYSTVPNEMAVIEEAKTIEFWRNNGAPLLNMMKATKSVTPPRILQNLEYAHLLGIESDGAIARKYGLAVSTVRDARIRRNVIVAPHSHLNKRNKDEYLHLLGVLTDGEIASQFGVSKQAVRKNRNKLNIPPAQHVEWSNYDHLLGTMPDIDIARTLNVSKGMVQDRRNKLVIAPFYIQNQGDWDQYDHLLGTMTDAAVAEKMGITGQSVWKRRKRLGVAKFRMINGKK